jgi:hypothetical protein
VVAVVLLATSGRYGYHRDELYFLAAGHHLAWGYPDQPPLTPAIIHLTDLLGGSLPVLRTPSALAAALTVLLTGLTTRELGGGRRAQLVAAGCSGVSAVTLVTGHFVTTTTFDVLFSVALCWLLARTIRTGDHRLLVPAGLVLGLGLMNKNLIGVLAAALVASIAITGPRRLLASRWLWLGALIAVAGGLPYVLWQAANGWPQVHMAGRISGGDDQGGRVGFVPFQLVLVSPLLVPVWLAGLRRLLRDPDARPYRAFGLGYLLLGAVYLVAGGKAYYLAGMYPVLIAAGGIAVDGWLRRAAERGRGRNLRTRLTVAIGLTAVINALVGLALLPTSALGPVLAVNPDAGEMVGWPRFADAVASAWNLLPPGERGQAVILARNYGEAGALLRYGPERHLPAPYSGHNGFALLGGAARLGHHRRRRRLQPARRRPLVRQLRPRRPGRQPPGRRQRGAGQPDLHLPRPEAALVNALAAAGTPRLTALQRRQVPAELERRDLGPVLGPLGPLVAQEEVEHALAEGLGDQLRRLHRP